jgi:hypothetical protein
LGIVKRLRDIFQASVLAHQGSHHERRERKRMLALALSRVKGHGSWV